MREHMNCFWDTISRSTEAKLYRQGDFNNHNRMQKRDEMKRYVWALLLLGFYIFPAWTQSAPAEEENIPYLVTFGGQADKSWGDDDFCQIFFIQIPTTQTQPIYIRVFDPDTGGELDEGKGEFNTKVRFSVYGGAGCYSHKDAQNVDPIGNYKSGNL